MKGGKPLMIGSMPINMLMYADDILLLSNSKADMQKHLDACYIYFKKWKLDLNVKKTKIVVFNQTTCNAETLYYGDQTIKEVKEYKYLGLLIDKNISFKGAVADLVTRASRAYASLYQSLNVYEGANPKTIMKVFDVTVVPILMYCSEVWATYRFKGSADELLRHISNGMETLHSRVCRHVLGMKRGVSNVACRAELGRLPMVITAITNAYKYLLRLQGTKDNSLLGQATVTQKLLQISKKPSIFSFIERTCMLTNPQLGVKMPKALTKCELDGLGKKQKRKLISLYEKNQKSQIAQNKKLELLTIVKPNVKLENYLTQINTIEQRKAFTKLRISAHNFDIEKGRKDKTPRHLRQCRACTSSAIGDEYHVLMTCTNTYLQSLRDQCYKLLSKSIPQFCKLTTLNKFIYIISGADTTCCGIVAPYVAKCMSFLR